MRFIHTLLTAFTASAALAGPVTAQQLTFMTGFIQNNNYVARPVDVLPMKDGSLLVSDDFNGAVYRVSRTQ